ncbi:hypothetical protein ABZ807_32635 [Micromonospora sp. NPDC047548]|uniref:hypothetical protein n=1 Tax=Micromonospora sp. NPDC047548 TaxID=3155624 RepID=UPI0033E03681
MLHLDAIGRWVALATGRTLDQHAADPIPAAAHLPQAASTLRQARAELLLAVDRLRTLLINADDLTGSVSTVTGPLETITVLACECRYARNWIDALIEDPARAQYADANPGRSLRRRYVNPSDTVLVVLPHTDSCRKHQLAGRTTRVRVGESDAELDLTVGPGQLRLSHADAGIYRDPAEGGLYILQSAADEPATSGR